MRALLLVAALAGCWTGGGAASETTLVNQEAPRDPARRDFKLKLERTACMGACPIYTLVIHGDGRVEWLGKDNVAALGPRRGRASPSEIAELERMLLAMKFFDRDEYGHLPIEPQCTTVNGTTSCTMGGSFSFCTDTSHTLITVTRKSRTHTVDNQNCSDDDDLSALENLIDRIANVRAWVGE